MLSRTDKLIARLMHVSDREMETLKLFSPNRDETRKLRDEGLARQISVETLAKAEAKRKRKAWKRALTG